MGELKLGNARCLTGRPCPTPSRSLAEQACPLASKQEPGRSTRVGASTRAKPHQIDSSLLEERRHSSWGLKPVTCQHVFIRQNEKADAGERQTMSGCFQGRTPIEIPAYYYAIVPCPICACCVGKRIDEHDRVPQQTLLYATFSTAVTTTAEIR
jgi:hypothetical protein